MSDDSLDDDFEYFAEKPQERPDRIIFFIGEVLQSQEFNAKQDEFIDKYSHLFI
jgi:hypothetical protein